VRCDFYIFEFVIVRLVVGLGLKLGLGLGIRKRVRGGKKGWMNMIWTWMRSGETAVAN